MLRFLLQIPRADNPRKPDFMADESQYKGKISNKYYLSQKALGQLFRAIDLPGEKDEVSASIT